MRARYSAYESGNVQFILDTWHPDHRFEEDIDDIREFANSNEWLELRVLKTQGMPRHATGMQASVEFVAFFRQKGQQGFNQHHEKSTFRFLEGHWYFVEGKPMPPIKLNRNDSCPCGSGKKYKICCGC
ncbi:UPF0225 protein [Marinibactrum halimedae]|uniref:UPF0225 protein n=2 Tax=Marinibactrum halimedae TaxID=1444977 RepID=A0AA37WNI9_9GAMM|nr:UPF0225 protein [Marinibactrum halimedae]